MRTSPPVLVGEIGAVRGHARSRSPLHLIVQDLSGLGYQKCAGDGNVCAVAQQSGLRRTSAGCREHSKAVHRTGGSIIAFSEWAFLEKRPASSSALTVQRSTIELPRRFRSSVGFEPTLPLERNRPIVRRHTACEALRYHGVLRDPHQVRHVRSFPVLALRQEDLC